MSSRMNRRRFLQASAAAGAGYFLSTSALSAGRVGGANGKLYFAGIGIGGKGSSDISQTAKLGEVVAICDIDENNLNAKINEKEKKTGKQAFLSSRKFYDYRKMLDEMGKQI